MAGDGEVLNVGIDVLHKSEAKRFLGDNRVYDWYHALPGFSSDIITSALMAIEKWLYDQIDNEVSVEEWLNLILEESKSLAFIGLLSEIGRYDPELFGATLRPILLVPDFYSMEYLYIAQGGHEFGTPFFNQGEWFWKLTREWDSMEHRRRLLINIAANLFKSNAETRTDLIMAREKWKEKINLENVKQREVTRELITAFDPVNWKKVELPNGSINFVYNEPKHMQVEPDEIDVQKNLHFPFNRRIECSKRLVENRPVPDDQLSEFLNQVKELSGLKRDDQKPEEYTSIADAICGTIAVLFQLNRTWLRENQQEELWCIEKLNEIVDDLPAGSVWLEFVCDVLPILWSETPYDSRLRTMIAKLVVTGRYDAPSHLIRKSFNKRKELGAEFWKLVNFVLEWAGVLYDIRVTQAAKKKININKLQNRTAQKFIRGNFTGEMLPWGKESIKTGKLRSYWNHPRYMNDRTVSLFYYFSRIDIELIRYTFKEIFFPDQASDDDERSRFFDFWDQALVTSLTRTKYYDEKGIALENEKFETGMPFDYDNWVLERLAIVIAQMRPDESPERYWFPILSLGPRAEYWIERFLNHWFMDAKTIADHDLFIYHWQQMIKFCLLADLWINPEVPFAYHQSSLLLRLIGISDFSGSFWTDDDKSIIAAMEMYIVQIAPRILRDRSNSERFVSWLCEISSYPIHLQMLKPLSSIVEEASKYWWEDQRLITAIARYLNVLWDEHHQELRTDSNLRQYFEILLHATSARHEPLALELQTRISSRL